MTAFDEFGARQRFLLPVIGRPDRRGEMLESVKPVSTLNEVFKQKLLQVCRLRVNPDRNIHCPLLAFALSISPSWKHSRVRAVAAKPRNAGTKDAVDPIVHKGYLCELADAYAPNAIDRKNPLISPLFADLSGFPPMLIQVGSAEALLSDATGFAAAVGSFDVDMTLEIWPHIIHAWPVWNAKLSSGRRALARAGEFMRAHDGRL